MDNVSYRINGRRVSKEEWDAHYAKNPCNYEKGEIPAMRMAADWSSENNGRGRKLTQLKKHPKDDGEHCYARSQQDAIDKASKAGLIAQKDG